MGKEWLWWLGEFGLAATVAVIAGFVTRDVPISILYGLFIGSAYSNLPIVIGRLSALSSKSLTSR